MSHQRRGVTEKLLHRDTHREGGRRTSATDARLQCGHSAGGGGGRVMLTQAQHPEGPPRDPTPTPREDTVRHRELGTGKPAPGPTITLQRRPGTHRALLGSSSEPGSSSEVSGE